MMNTLEQLLVDRFHAADPSIEVPATSPVDDVRRGAARLRRRRAAAAGGGLAAAAVVAGGIALGTGGTTAVDSEFAKDPVPTYEPEPHAARNVRKVEPPAVAAALEGYEAVVDEHLGELGDTPSTEFMNHEAEYGRDTITVTTDPSDIGLMWRIGLGEAKAHVHLGVFDNGEETFEGFGECARGDQCEDLAPADPSIDAARAIYSHGQLYHVVVHTTEGVRRAFGLVNRLGESEPAMPWTADDLVQLLLDPRLELPTLE